MKNRPSALVLVVFCFLGSGLLRIWDSAALAAESLTRPDTSAPLAGAACPQPPEPSALLLAIQERADQLDAFEGRLADREQVLNVAKLKVEQKLEELRQAEQSLAATIASADGAAENDILRMTAVYESMKPQNAAKLFETMDIEFASNFLIRMNPESAANIMSNIEPDIAYSISIMMASRNANVPKE